MGHLLKNLIRNLCKVEETSFIKMSMHCVTIDEVFLQGSGALHTHTQVQDVAQHNTEQSNKPWLFSGTFHRVDTSISMSVVSAQGDPCTATIFDLFCLPSTVLRQ
jgi:hypothetical protein